MRMMQHAIYTVSRMIFLIRHYLKPYGIKEVWQLPNHWDVSGLVLPHMHDLCGFNTSQHGDRMHEFLLKKDSSGVVRLHMRKSSKSSGWLPEGPGYAVFKIAPPLQLQPAPMKNDAKWHCAELEGTIHNGSHSWLCQALSASVPKKSGLPSTLACRRI